MGWTYGPISEGVTGSEGGGGRLMRVGVDMLVFDCWNEVQGGRYASD